MKVETSFDTGDTIIPGTDNKKAKATATAVIKPRCEFDGRRGRRSKSPVTVRTSPSTPTTTDLDLEPSDLFSVVLVG